MTTWIRRSFDAAGLTQYPVGRHLDVIQAQFGGAVILCLDVSGSMYGSPLRQAVKGCEVFIDEALGAGYLVSMLFWHHSIDGYTPLTRERAPLVNYLRTAAAGGGNDICPTLRHAEAELSDRQGDRVVAIFGDGDLGSQSAAELEADRLRADNIRIITCGLGYSSAESLDAISTEEGAAPRTAEPETIAESIAAMASGLRRGRTRGPAS